MSHITCNFCLKKNSEVEFIFKKNDHTAICCECIDIASAILQERRDSKKETEENTVVKGVTRDNLLGWDIDETLARSLGLNTLLKYGVIPSSARSILLRFACFDLDNLHKKSPPLSNIIQSLEEFDGNNISISYIFSTKEHIEKKIKKIFEQ